ncbi:hypothetical protein DERP_009152 [Dermatophagoides pteronyssinus]|uniref:Uncharacterized protein n=1 Tax=Dermatophagoides pteronyssinus TaxID=6956 RepID=A0ABQ8JQP1_DERPT|nr:hypothetical protein DERP_009152 [Dermatophagoides pteronyssinus]
MDSAQVGVFEQTDQISFRSFLIRRNREIRITITNIHSRRMVKDGAIVLLHTCNAPMAALWKRKSVLKSWAISRTKRWNGRMINTEILDQFSGQNKQFFMGSKIESDTTTVNNNNNKQ